MQTELLFYDGHCALCHGAVKFVLKHDPLGKFRFAPLHGETFQKRVPASQREGLPDSIVAQTLEGSLLVRSDAFLHILWRIGGRWSFLASVIRFIPRTLRDAIYDFVASARYKVFGQTSGLCPIV